MTKEMGQFTTRQKSLVKMKCSQHFVLSFIHVELRLLQTFAGIHQKKIRARAVFNEKPQTIYQ